MNTESIKHALILSFLQLKELLSPIYPFINGIAHLVMLGVFLVVMAAYLTISLIFELLTQAKMAAEAELNKYERAQ